jgi:hypothetical protein
VVISSSHIFALSVVEAHVFGGTSFDYAQDELNKKAVTIAPQPKENRGQKKT